MVKEHVPYIYIYDIRIRTYIIYSATFDYQRACSSISSTYICIYIYVPIYLSIYLSLKKCKYIYIYRSTYQTKPSLNLRDPQPCHEKPWNTPYSWHHFTHHGNPSGMLIFIQSQQRLQPNFQDWSVLFLYHISLLYPFMSTFMSPFISPFRPQEWPRPSHM